MSCCVLRLYAKTLFEDGDQVRCIGAMEEHSMVVNSIEGEISLGLVCSVAGLRFDFKNVGEQHWTDVDAGLLCLLPHALRLVLFFVASKILAWFWFAYVTTVHIPNKEFILITIRIHGLQFAIQVLVAVIVWIHFVQVLSSSKQQLRAVLYFS